MNIQIFGKSKCFDTKKAERYFKERGIKFQSIDLIRFGMSGKEFDLFDENANRSQWKTGNRWLLPGNLGCLGLT